MGESGELPARMAIPLAFLYTQRSEAVEGVTRFQKLVFLGQKESQLPEEYEYEPDKYGPYSRQLQSDIYELTERGYVEKNEVVNNAGNTKHVFSLNPEGIRAAKDFLGRDTTGRIFGSANEVKKEWGDERLGHLLRYVYNKYKEYTTSTELDLDRLFDPESESQFLDQEDGSEEYLGGGPGSWKDVNPSADELFSTD
jgi:uncharacterized protein YwgA